MTSSLAAAPAPRATATARPVFDWLFVVAVLAVVATYVRAIYFTPVEAMQGPAQKILYVHATAAFVGLYLCFGLVAITSLLYLWMKDERLDRAAAASAEVGVMFTTVVLGTGPLWGKPIWGAWWTWDARLTLTLFLWFVGIGYIILRGAVEEPLMRARFSAVLGIMAALLVPFIHLSVYLFRTLHPMPILLKPSAPSMPREMQLTFLMAFVAFSLLFAAFLRARYRLAVRADLLSAREEALL